MLTDLVVRNLALIKDLDLEIGGGFTVLTGETGAGKTMLTGAVSLLAGGRADPLLIRPGSEKATVEGRFELPNGKELLITRELSHTGRSRIFIDGRLSGLGMLSETAGALVDICGQRRHQSLFKRSARRKALDTFGGVDLSGLAELRARRAGIEKRLEEIGGDARTRAREMEVLEYQLRELDGASLDDPQEEKSLEELEQTLANAADIREAAERGAHVLGGDGPVLEVLAEVHSATDDAVRFPSLLECARRVADLQAEVSDLAAELRSKAEEVTDDPQRLAEVVERRAALAGLRRKYGETLEDVIAYRTEARSRLETLRGADELCAELTAQLSEAVSEERAEAARVGAQRRESAPALAERVSEELRLLAMPKASLLLRVGDEDPGDDVEFLLAVNSGSSPIPLSKTASGGELSRTMLALYVVLLESPPTVVLDEVDAGIGGEAGVWVGRALARLSTFRQILVVTHLPQVAAYADAHISISKVDDGSTSWVEARRLSEEERKVELARMLSGSPESESARRHAGELLKRAAADRNSSPLRPQRV